MIQLYQNSSRFVKHLLFQDYAYFMKPCGAVLLAAGWPIQIPLYSLFLAFQTISQQELNIHLHYNEPVECKKWTIYFIRIV